MTKLIPAGLAALALLSACATSRRDDALKRFEFERPQMGVPFKVVLYAANENHAERAAQAAFDRVSELNAIMSDYESESELSRLGRASGSGRAVKVSGELWTVLAKAREISRASGGALDVTVGPYIQLWRRARRIKEMPDPALLERARERVGHTKLVLNNHSAKLTAPDMRLDLGAIAKGYAADEALRVLKKHGIRRAFAAASGDMALGDPPPGQKGWKVQLLNTSDGPGTPFLVLRNCGVATSGDLFQFVEIGGKRYSHIVDPRTGIGLTDRSLVTVIAKDGITADGLSTAISVMEQGTGLELARRYRAEARHTRQTDTAGRFEAATAGFWKSVEWAP